MAEHDAELKPCRRCGAPCRVEEFSNELVAPTKLWLCSKHKFFGGDCPSGTAYLTEEAWNDPMGPLLGEKELRPRAALTPSSAREEELREALVEARNELYLNLADKTSHLIAKIDAALQDRV